MVGIGWKLLSYQDDCVNAFRMEFSEKDIKHNKDAKKLARFINRQGKRIDKILRILKKI